MIDCTLIHYTKRDFDLNEIIEHLNTFKKHLAFTDAVYLSEHLSVEIPHGWVTCRNPANDWYHKSYVAKLDGEAKEFCGISEKNQFIFVHGSRFYDEYVTHLLGSYRIDLDHQKYNEGDIIEANKALKQWKENILRDYNRDEHIRVLTHNLASFYKEEDRNEIFKLSEQVISPNKVINFNEIHTKDLVLEILDYKVQYHFHPSPFQEGNYWAVKIKSCHGLFSNFTSYGSGHFYTSRFFFNEKFINIPELLSLNGRGTFVITEIGDNVFDNLLNAEEILLPPTLLKLKWSFWNCKRLRKITIRNSHYSFCKSNNEFVNNLNNLGKRSNWNYLEYPFTIKKGIHYYGVYSLCKHPALKSQDGVLYNYDMTELIAFPNLHSKRYEVPEGVIRIREKAFKDCDNIEELYLPSTIKEIGVNAFYRCINLKRIIVNQAKDSLQKEKRIGEYGDVNPIWYWKE